ncbi:HCL326Cp [Eremothecium sinecaudum]|uniref:HCL326Cp n=1 Tax=Eremothecium sinecaudum TaxID=45286 RepID=A0A109UWF6_9SACH|nr:HCL326Cp [Eremothecium sinecaudum]AMD19825.1 HCL326Cp [Eremothecium sinecaudum]
MPKLTPTGHRTVPLSLIQRQIQRTGSPSAKAAAAKAAGAQLLAGSFKDLGSMFSLLQSSEDDELEIKQRAEANLSMVRSGEAEHVLRQKYCVRDGEPCSANLLLAKFPGTRDEQDLIQIGVSEMNSRVWKEVPDVWKQIAYFQAFGPWGPRKGISFTGKPEDFFAKDKKQLWSCTKFRQQDLTKMNQLIDPISRWILFAGAVLSSIAIIMDLKRRRHSDDAMVTVLDDLYIESKTD